MLSFTCVKDSKFDDAPFLVGRKDSYGNISQFFYTIPGKPFLVSQVYQPRESRITSLVYDNEDKLIFVKINQVQYYDVLMMGVM